ncbi:MULTISPECIES: DNA repair protein RecO [unclassified Janibacter]|uniref:DNA repair protein RecO n=1 Tax=unclassified Janibacter TaxID=2649294 RepID=UPI003CFDBFC3
MPLYRDDAIVLRTQKLGEADRIITVLTRQRGKVRVVGKGVRRTKSRFGSRLEPAMHIDLQCYEGRNLDTVTQVETRAPWGDAIARDYPTWTAASAVLETVDRLTEERTPAIQQYLLLAGALSSLAGGVHDPGLVLDAYLLRALAIAGWAPSFHDCARCGEEGPHRAFNVASGGSVCPSCRPPGSAAPAPETLEFLAALLAGDWAVADASLPRQRSEGAGLTAAFLQWHLEHGVRSLKHVDRSRPRPATVPPVPDEPIAFELTEPQPTLAVHAAHAAIGTATEGDRP